VLAPLRAQLRAEVDLIALADDLRSYAFVVHVLGTWPSPQHDAATIGWVRRCSDGIARGQPRRAYVNFAGAGSEPAEVAFAPDIVARLREAKRRYDPEAMFI
jgi:hypothetical protein